MKPTKSLKREEVRGRESLKEWEVAGWGLLLVFEYEWGKKDRERVQVFIKQTCLSHHQIAFWIYFGFSICKTHQKYQQIVRKFWCQTRFYHNVRYYPRLLTSSFKSFSSPFWVWIREIFQICNIWHIVWCFVCVCPKYFWFQVLLKFPSGRVENCQNKKILNLNTQLERVNFNNSIKRY